jgi:hypothetical protein
MSIVKRDILNVGVDKRVSPVQVRKQSASDDKRIAQLCHERKALNNKLLPLEDEPAALAPRQCKDQPRNLLRILKRFDLIRPGLRLRP